MNKVELVGRLTKDPEVKLTSNQTQFCNFTIAVDRRFKDQNGQRQADFINCVAWRNSAEFIARYFQKGSMIAVTGSIQTRNYEDKNGNKRTATEVVVDQASFCGSKSETGTSGYSAPSAMPEAPSFSTGSDGDFEEISGDDDLPF